MKKILAMALALLFVAAPIYRLQQKGRIALGA